MIEQIFTQDELTLIRNGLHSIIARARLGAAEARTATDLLRRLDGADAPAFARHAAFAEETVA